MRKTAGENSKSENKATISTQNLNRLSPQVDPAEVESNTGPDFNMPASRALPHAEYEIDIVPFEVQQAQSYPQIGNSSQYLQYRQQNLPPHLPATNMAPINGFVLPPMQAQVDWANEQRFSHLLAAVPPSESMTMLTWNGDERPGSGLQRSDGEHLSFEMPFKVTEAPVGDHHPRLAMNNALVDASSGGAAPNSSPPVFSGNLTSKMKEWLIDNNLKAAKAKPKRVPKRALPEAGGPLSEASTSKKYQKVRFPH